MNTSPTCLFSNAANFPQRTWYIEWEKCYIIKQPVGMSLQKSLVPRPLLRTQPIGEAERAFNENQRIGCYPAFRTCVCLVKGSGSTCCVRHCSWCWGDSRPNAQTAHMELCPVTVFGQLTWSWFLSFFKMLFKKKKKCSY